MKITVRVDDRLIHGQVVVGWIQRDGYNHVIVVDEEAAANSEVKEIMKAVLPAEVKLWFSKPSEIGKFLKKLPPSAKVLILVRNTETAEEIFNNGLRFKELNIGGMHFSEGKKKILENVYVSEQDLKHLYALTEKGVHIDTRALPQDKPKNFLRLAAKVFKRKR